MARRYPKQPIPAVAALLVDGDRVLLALRRDPPHAGCWAVPGGMQEIGEHAADAVRREVREETGLEIAEPRLLNVDDILSRDDAGRLEYHYVITYFVARPAGGRLQHGDNVSDVRWATLEEARRMNVSEGIIELMEKALGAGPERAPHVTTP